jgi:hypothetical protein
MTNANMSLSFMDAPFPFSLRRGYSSLVGMPEEQLLCQGG